MFGESLQFKVGGNDSFKSIIGALVSLAIFATVLPYGVNKFIILYQKNDTSYQSWTEKSLDPYEEFGYD